MKIGIISSSPNANGLTAACAQAAIEGARKAGFETVIIDLNSFEMSSCRACGNGWGTCRQTRRCQHGSDGFDNAHDLALTCDCYFFVSPVYYGELSESAKAFTDRFRRCEASRIKNDDNKGNLSGRPWVLTAAAGGMGGGTLSCLTSMERFLHNLGSTVADYIPITRKSRSYKLNCITDAVNTMCENLRKSM